MNLFELFSNLLRKSNSESDDFYVVKTYHEKNKMKNLLNILLPLPFIDIKGLLTEREVCTVKYQTEVLVRTKRARSELKKTEVRYFTVQTKQARSINCLLYGSQSELA